MKIRNGFVSNSSSSSFVIIGKPIKQSEITEEMLKEKKISAIGGYIEEGRLVIGNMDWEMFKFINDNSERLEETDIGGFDYYETFLDVEDYGTIDKEDLPDGKIEVIGGMFDHGSPTSVNEFEELLSYYD